ncbi:hypothetical protein YC2023_014576 [Brassica napus]
MDRDQDVATNRCIWVNGPVIAGAGQSGLATAACLPFVVLERADCFASLWRKRTYDRLKLHLPKQFCQLPKFPFPEFPTKRQLIDYLESYAPRFKISPEFNERVQTATSGWRVKTLSNAESTRTKVEYVGRQLGGATGENTEMVMPEMKGLSEFTSEMTYYVNWNGTQALDRVLDQQKAQVCYAISMTRQLGALLRLEGLLEPHESPSIQYVINETRRLLLDKKMPIGCGWDGSIPQLEMLTPFYTLNGIVLNDLVPLTYSLESTNPAFDEEVRRFKATEIIHHYLAKDDDTFEGKLLSFLMDSPVSIAEIYYPTETDLHNDTSGHYHVMLLTGAGYDEKGNGFWECQDSYGDGRGDGGFIRIAMGTRLISLFVEMSIGKGGLYPVPTPPRMWKSSPLLLLLLYLWFVLVLAASLAQSFSALQRGLLGWFSVMPFLGLCFAEHYKEVSCFRSCCGSRVLGFVSPYVEVLIMKI